MTSATEALATAAEYRAPAHCTRAIAFFRAGMLTGALALVAVFFVVAPQSRATVARQPLAVPSMDGAAQVLTSGPRQATKSGDAVMAPEVAPVPRAASTLDLRIGPAEDYVVIGTVPRNGRLEVVGRNPEGTWLAVAVAPGSALYGWLPAGRVADQPDVSDLGVKPVVLPSR